MKIPKTVKRHCPNCKKHTEHTISQAKKKGLNAVHTQSRSSKVRVQKRGQRRGAGNLGRFSRKPMASRKMSGKKLTKKTDLRFACKTCGKQHSQSKGIRLKKVEII